MGEADSPWDAWIPGVLSRSQVIELAEKGFLSGVSETTRSIGASSLDLTLSSDVYHLPEGAIKPSDCKYQDELDQFGHRIDLPDASETILKAHHTYVVKLREQLVHLKNTHIFGQATAKSSVGRMDVLARLIVDGMNCYEAFSPSHISTGDLFLEITPLTFAVRVKPGISLSQLRLFYGDPEDCRLSGNVANETYIKKAATKDGTISVDLTPVDINGHRVIAFQAKDTSSMDLAPVPLWDGSAPSPCDYWNFVLPNETKRLSLVKGSFYILRSKELLALPKGVAVYCRANDESFGEMRIHYAGFAHPLFGRSRTDQTGTPLIFEVRGHDVNVSLKDGESMARLLFYRMSEDAREDDTDQAYETQQLKLSKFFRDWPGKIEVDTNGAVKPSATTEEAEI
jgi:dCTP deaminase